VGRRVRAQTCEACAQLFPARQVIDGKMRSLYGRRFCLACSTYIKRGIAAPASRVVARRIHIGRDEWFFRAVGALISFRSPERAPIIARTGVALLSLSLLLPAFASSFVPRPTSHIVIAAASDVAAVPADQLPPLPEPIARARHIALVPDPGPQAIAAPIAAPETAPAPAAGSGSVVTASWYGPGFYENRLPCWQWLAAHGLPIQLLPDTWGVAHKSLPCGTMVTLSHGANTVTVPVVDRGPYVAGREFDLTARVKAALGCTDLCTVVMQIR